MTAAGCDCGVDLMTCTVIGFNELNIFSVDKVSQIFGKGGHGFGLFALVLGV
jgi:hypothetical protein